MYTIGRCPHCEEIIKTNNINMYVHHCFANKGGNLYVGDQGKTNFLVGALTIKDDGTAFHGKPTPPQVIDENIF